FGGTILEWVNWPTIFIILSLIGVVMFLGVFFILPETLPEENRSEARVLAVFRSFHVLLKDRGFMMIALTQAMISTSMFAYIAGSPFVLQNIYNVTPQQFSF